MSYCVTFTLPNGVVAVLRPNPQLVAALLLPALSDVAHAVDQLRIPRAIAEDFRRRMTALTEKEAARVIAERDAPRVATGKGFLPTDVRDLTPREETGLLDPSDAGLAARRRFRSTWRQSGTALPAIDMPLARIQRMNEIRAERAPKLQKSDSDFVRAIETGNTALQTSLKDYRQTLRALPATEKLNVETITAPDALAAWNPTWPVDPAT